MQAFCLITYTLSFQLLINSFSYYLFFLSEKGRTFAC